MAGASLTNLILTGHQWTLATSHAMFVSLKPKQLKNLLITLGIISQGQGQLYSHIPLQVAAVRNMLEVEVAGEDDLSSLGGTSSRNSEAAVELKGEPPSKKPRTKKQQKQKKRKEQAQEEDKKFEKDLEEAKKQEEKEKKKEATTSQEKTNSGSAPAASSVAQNSQSAPARGQPRGQQRNSGKKGSNKDFSEGQISLMELIVKALLQVTQLGRDTQAALCDVFLIPAVSSFVMSAHRQGKRYAAATQGKTGHGLGPPHLFVFAALVDYVHTNAIAGSAACLTMERWKEFSLEQKQELVRLCKCVRMFNQDQRKFVVIFGPGQEAQAIRNDLLAALKGVWDWKQGRPPPGNMERRLGEWLKDMVS
jgi:hypothetical protein